MRKTWGSSRQLGAAVIAGAIAFATGAHAEPDDAAKNAARELAEQAAEAVEKGDHATAQDLYARAYALVPAPTLSLREARSLAQLGRWVEALEAYVRTTRSALTGDAPEPLREAVRQAHDELAALRPRVPRLTVIVKGVDRRDPDLTVRLNERTLPRSLVGARTPVNPGSYEVVAETKDGRRATASVQLAERETKSIELELPAARSAPAQDATPSTQNADGGPNSSPAGNAQRTWGFVALGVGGAGLGLGLVTGLMATSKHTSAEEGCPKGVCVEGSAGADDAEAFRSLRTVSTVGYVVGVIGVGAGVTLLLTAPKREAAASAYLGLGSAGVRGVF